MPQGLPRKLKRAFILQAVTASFAIVIGIYATGSIFKEVLTQQRLHEEADKFWHGRADDPAWPLPDTVAVQGYLVDASHPRASLPTALAPLSPGVHDLHDHFGRVLVEQRGGERLYLAMQFALLDRAVRWTSLAAMALALIAIYIVTWLTYRRSKRLVAPVNWLAGQVSRWDPRDPDTDAIALERAPGGAGSEVEQLAQALRDLATRTHDFVQRERDFTRDASHELRTPLTVIRVATDLMLSDPDIPERAHRPLWRMQRAGRDMEAVIDAFLILAREGNTLPLIEEFDVREVIADEIDKARPLLAGKPVELALVESASPRLHASPRALAVMFGQLLENACNFTDRGRIEVRIEADRIVVRDSGIGMSSEVLQRAYDPFYRAEKFNPSGKGMGLSIVRRLGERFGWPVTLDSTPGVGTTATIGFGPRAVG